MPGRDLPVNADLVVWSGRYSEFSARSIVENDDLAADLGALGDGPRPLDAERSVNIFGFISCGLDRVDPVSRGAIDIHHAGDGRPPVAERASDEQVVGRVVVVHVPHDSCDDRGVEKEDS